MSARIQTTIDQTASVVLIIAPQSVFTTELCKGIDALHLTPVLVSPERVGEIVYDPRQRLLFSRSYLCMWLDLPLFSDQQKKLEIGQEVLAVLESQLRVPLFHVSFDALYTRKNGKQGEIPTYASTQLHRLVSLSHIAVTTFVYQHVVYPYEGGCSVILRFILEKIAQGNKLAFTGEWTPVWYGDVIAHIVKKICSSQSKSGVFSGSRSESLADFETRLRAHAHMTKISATSQTFPFEFEAGEGIAVGTEAVYLDDISARIPKERSTNPQDIPQKKVFTVEKKKKIHHVKRKRVISRIAFSLGIGAVFLYVAVTVYFFSSVLHFRRQVREIAIAKTDQELRMATRDSAFFRLPTLRLISKHIPIPYEVLGLDLHPDGILAGIDSTEQLLDGIGKYQEVGENIHAQLHSQNQILIPTEKNTSLLDESTKELASIQAQISQRDLIFDSFYGMDGLSDQLFQSIVRLRQEVSQTRVFLLVLEQISNKEKPTTVAMVSLDSATARPLIGIPTVVLISRFEQGRVLTTQEYPVHQLDTFLKGKVENPEEVKEYIGTDSQWRLSDGAWSVDGPTSARQISWFLSKQLKTDIDLAFFFAPTSSDSLKSLLLSFTKPEIDLSSDRSVSQVLGIQTIARPFLASLGTQSLSDDQPSTYSKLFSDLQQSNVVIYSRENDVSAALKTIGWDGSITTPNCPPGFTVDRQCIVSTRYLAEYDLTPGEEVNAQKENQTHSVEFLPHQVLHTDSVLFSKSRGEKALKLLKYSVDSDARNISVHVNGAPYILKDSDIGQEYGKTTISLLTSLSHVEKTVVTLQYATNAIDSKGSSFVFFVQKQPGKTAEPFGLEFQTDAIFSPRIVAPVGNIGKNSVSFMSSLDESRVFAIGF